MLKQLETTILLTAAKTTLKSFLAPRLMRPAEESAKLRKYIPSQKLTTDGIRNVILLKDTEVTGAGNFPLCDWRIHFEIGVYGSCTKRNSEVRVYMGEGAWIYESDRNTVRD